MKNAFGVLQKVGKSLMLPVAILPAAGILLALGIGLLQNPILLSNAPALHAPWVQLLSNVLGNAGNIIFSNLALLFAVGVAVGLTGGDGVAALAAIIGFLIMNMTMSGVLGITEKMINASNPSYAMVLGIPTLQTGVFGGIIVGIIASSLYKRYYNIELPSFLGFFAGKRFVPIITAAVAVILGVVMSFVWSPIQSGLNTFSHSMIDRNLTLSAFIFGLVERSLIPFGLHHIWYSPFWFEFGSYTTKAGQIVHGDQAIFFAQLKDNVPFTAGTFMVGKFPFMMFGLPAAALAIYHTSRPENKKYVAGIMGSAALTSFLTGITEPIEFSFLFVAPILFAIHAVFAGLSFMIMQLLNVKIGMTFSGGVIDYLLFGVLPNRTPWWLVIPVGLVFAVIYYFGFRWAILKFDLKTPGREVETEEKDRRETSAPTDVPYQVLNALGGKENLSSLDACITRLRVQVKDIQEVDKNELKRLGAAGVLEVGNNIQAIFGPKSDILRGQIQDIIEGKKPAPSSEKRNPNTTAAESCPVLPTDGKIEVAVPVSGRILPLEQVPDEVFSKKMMGDGFAIEPTEGVVISPISGTVVTVFPTKHAIGLVADNGTEILIHVGIDTVNLKGEGFNVFVEADQKVKQGDKLLEVDLEYIGKHAKSTITPIVFTNLKEGQAIEMLKAGDVNRGETGIIQVVEVGVLQQS